MSPLRPWLFAVASLRPRPVSAALTLIGLGWLLAVLAAMVLLMEPTRDGVGTTGFISGAFGAGPALLVILAAAAFAGSWPARALVLWAATLVAAVGAAGMSALGLLGSTADPLIAGAIVGSVASIPLLVVALAAMASTALGLLDILRGLYEERLRRADQWLDTRGYALLPELGRALSLSPERAGELALDAEAELDPHAPVAWRPEQRARRVELLAGLVHSRGRVHVSELSQELRLREDLVHPLLSHAVATGGFQGAVTWEDGVVRLGVTGGDEGCPRCGDTLVQAGRGVRQCPACEVELFGA